MLSLRTFGAIDLVSEDGTPFSSILTQPKRTALLLYLALAPAGTFRRRDTLLMLFWPESDESRARNALNQLLHGLRQKLGADVVLTRGRHEVGLEPARIHCDVWAFRDALERQDHETALDLYQGPLAPGFHLDGADEFERWLEEKRGVLREEAAGAAWALARRQIRDGRLTEAERTAQRALSLVPTDETPVREFIAALTRAGDRAAAVNFYERFAARLEERLDLEPSPETAATAAAIRNSELVDVPDPRPAPIRSSRPSTPGESSPLEPLRGVQSKHGGRARASPRRLRWLVLLGLGLILIPLWPVESEPPDPNRIALAPFRNQTGDPSLDALGERVAEAIRWSLDRHGVGTVVPSRTVRTVVRDLDPDDDPVAAVAARTGASVVVTGEVFLEGDSVLVQTACVRNPTGEAIHPIDPVKRPLADPTGLLEEVQGRVTATLAQHTDTTFVADPSLEPPPANLEAFLEYRRGYEVLKLGGTLDEAAAHFQRAAVLDTMYLAPLLRLLAVYSSPSVGRREPYDTTLVRLERFRHRMTRFQRHYYDGIRLSVDGQQELAYREFLFMAEMSREEAATGLAEMAMLTNRVEQSVEAASWLDNGDGTFREPYVRFREGYWSLYTRALHLAGRYEKQLEIALEWKRRWPATDYGPVQVEADARVGLGDLEPLNELIEEWRGEQRLGPIWNLADELWVHGHEDAARTLLEGEVRRFDDDLAYIGRLNNQAMVLHRLGRNEEAYALWEAGVRLDREPSPWPWGVARIGFSAALAGQPQRAREMEHLLMSLDSLSTIDSLYVPFMQAQIAAALGEEDRAVRILGEWGRRGRVVFWLTNIHRNFTLQSLLRGHPAFQTLMRAKG